MSSPYSLRASTVFNGRSRASHLAYFLCFIALGLSTGSLGPTLPALAEQVRASMGNIGLLFTARSCGYLLGSLRGGKLFDFGNGNLVMAVTILLMVPLLFLVPFAPSLALLVVLMVLLGAAEAIVDVGANTLLIWDQGNSKAAHLNALHSFFAVGALVAPVVVALIVTLHFNSTASYFVLALLLLPVAGPLLASPTPKRRAIEQRIPQGSGRWWFILLIAAFLFLYVGAEVEFAGWIFTYATALNLGTAVKAAYLTSGFWASLTLGRLMSIGLPRGIKPSAILLADLLGALLSLGIITVWPYSFLAVSVGTVGLGFWLASVFPTTILLAAQRIEITGRETGWFIVGASAGSMVIPLVAGRTVELFGPQAVISVASFTLLLALVLLLPLLLSSKLPLRTGQESEST